MNLLKKLFKLTIAFVFVFSNSLVTVLAQPPVAPPGGGNSSSSSVTHNGDSTISSNTEKDGTTYTSTTGGKNALLVSGGASTLKNITITKSGDESDENSDFYGTNAALFVYNNAVLNVTGGTITTSGSHANAAFAYDTGVLNLTNTKIRTTGNNSGGIMVTGGGSITATNLDVETAGNSSAAIRSDRGGGTMKVNKGTYKTTGVGSPVIYSTADVEASDATLTATASEGVVIEGANSVSLKSCTLTDTNNKLNGQSETYKNIFLYQSMSGDADVGTSNFSATDSKIVTNKGDTIYVTNTTATISLSNNEIVNNDGDFLRIEAAAWGTSGSNGGNVTLNLTNQETNGNTIVDKVSTLSMNMTKSLYEGSINNENTAKSVSLKLDSDSVVLLTGDTYLTSLDNEDSDNLNIYLNGYSLYVNGKKVSANTGTYSKDGSKKTTKVVNKKSNNYILYTVVGGVIIALLVIVVIIVKKHKKKKEFI